MHLARESSVTPDYVRSLQQLRYGSQKNKATVDKMIELSFS
jgi:hypothetical protein